MKTGRNDPCPCNSGKKYKHCCLEKDLQNSRDEVDSSTAFDPFAYDPELSRIRRTEGRLIPAIIKFASGRRDVIREAVDEFHFWGELPFEDIDFENFFVPWIAFNWIPEPAETPALRGLTQEPLGIQYLRKNVTQLNSYEQAFIVTACTQPFTFWAIEDVVAGESLFVRDFFLDRTFTVKEASASKLLKKGDVVFGRVVPLDGQTIFVGLAPAVIPPRERLSLLDLRDTLKKALREDHLELNLEQLQIVDPELRMVYMNIAESLRNPPLPELQNTDGDPFSFAKLYFELDCSPEEAFEALKSLSLESADVILEQSIRDQEGHLVEVGFDWHKKGNKLHKHWDNTVMGNITIKATELTAEVNSEKRAKKFKSEVKKRLGARAKYKTGVHQSFESKLEETRLRQSGSDDDRLEMEELESLPEVQEFLRKEMDAHWESWYNERIPALKNKTPIEAARTKAGRERLEALLCDFERRNEEVPHPSLKVDVLAMRKRLGM